MFIVCNKDKIASYMVSFFTVMILLGIAFYMRNNSKMLEVSSTSKQLPIYSVKTDEKKVAFTMNCAWNADDIDQILKTLEENDVKITFFMVGDWVDKYPEAVKKISDAGHEIGNHSNTHPHVNNLTYEKNISEIEECNKKIEKITEPFYRVDKVRSRKNGGAGLGLSICKSIMELHKGDLKIESDIGKGSIFILEFPE